MINLNGKKILIAFCLVLLINISYGKVFQIVVKEGSEPTRWNKAPNCFGQPNLPIYALSARWPVMISNVNHKIPPGYISVMLETDLSKRLPADFEQDIYQLKKTLRQIPNIKYIILRGLTREDKNSFFVIKKISTAARGIIPEIKIGLAIDFRAKKKQILDQVKALIINREILPYFHALALPSLKYKNKIRQFLLKRAPSLEIWQSLAQIIQPDMKPAQIISAIIKSNPFNIINTSLFIVPSNNLATLFNPLVRFSSLINCNLYKYVTDTKIKTGSGKILKLNNYIKPADQSVIIFCNIDLPDILKIHFKKNSYRKSIIKNILNGEEKTFLIKRNIKQLNLRAEKGFYIINLIPAHSSLADSNYALNITGSYTPLAEEIIAKVRIWKETVRSKLKSFTARMSSSLRLRIANINETFDLTIKGPMFSERDKPYDWVWQEFYINGVKWKSKKVPKIPLLQPEKVNILPMDLSLSEEYNYTYVKETRLKGHSLYVINFKPKKEYRTKSSYYGTLWIDADNYFTRKEHLIQINLKGEVLSSIETRFYQQVGQDPQMFLPVLIKGHQVFSTAGRITNIEKEVILTGIKLNPPDLILRRKKAYKSHFQIVRDTDKGLRYLIKDKNSQKRKVEWKIKKSQLLWVLGGFFDTSLSFPIPVIGINYMNFNLGGKGRQVNILFGGAMLTANFTDPSLLGSKIDLGASLVAIALPFNNSIYRNNQKIVEETVKRWPFKFQINTGFPLGPYLKFSSFLFLNYDNFATAKHTSEDFTLPQSTFTYGLRSRLTASVKGYKLSLWGALARRSNWQFWGQPENDCYNQNQQVFYRWRFTISKDFFLPGFKKFHFNLGYYDGLNLDRFSAYKFGFFNELRMHGFMSGVVQATSAYMLNLSYGYNIGRAFRLELSYDSSLVTNKFNDYKNTYFSSAALSGTVNIPGINMICRFEAGLPVFSNGIKGFVFYLILMKML